MSTEPATTAQILGVVATGTLLALAYQAAAVIRTRRARRGPEPSATLPPRTLVRLDFTVGGTTCRLVTDHPIQPADLQAVRAHLVRTRGPIAGHNGVVSLIEAVAANEARDLDADLAALTDGGQR